MSKYDLRICKCGRIHMISNEKIVQAIENNKDILLVCGGCGVVTSIGADIVPDFDNPDKDAYEMYSRNFGSPYKETYIGASDFEESESHKAIEEIIYSPGIKVPMKTGQYASDYCTGIGFSDRWYPDFYRIQRNDITVKEIMDFINDYTTERRTVNMSRFIEETPDEMLEEISKYSIEGLNWKGTKWESNQKI